MLLRLINAIGTGLICTYTSKSGVKLLLVNHFSTEVGNGKDINLDSARDRSLNSNASSTTDLYVPSYCPQERVNYEYIVVEGKIIHKLTGNELDTIDGMKEGKWIFVMSTSKKLYAGKNKKGMFHRSSFLVGGATLAAGRLSISAYSGHYRPADDGLDSFLSFLKENGVNLDEVEDNGKASSVEKPVEFSISLVPTEPEIDEAEKNLTSESSEANQTKTTNTYKRFISGGLQSRRANVPEKAILQRINSKKAAKSCIAGYPVELRQQALAFVNLSPRTQTHSPFLSPRTQRTPTTPLACRIPGGLASTTSQLTSNSANADGISGI
ncbi:hypothetical protein V6N11_078891 [Hibiscus sabdariffa]|uniref:Uncharacterized protein n=1 Tax=Hibiscus sabdariffa TaxID=183260 RepID=A0ABR2RTT7_9ROSI